MRRSRQKNAEGKYKGRKPKARDKKLDIQRMSAEGMKPRAISEVPGISVPSVYKFKHFFSLDERRLIPRYFNWR